jgi:molecular chaperone HscB
MEYILKEKGIYGEEGKNKVPQDFLMEMMDINEALMELEFDFDQATFETAKQNIKDLEAGLYNEILGILKNYDNETVTAEELEQIKDFHFKRKYLLRIQNNLSTFAAL